MRSAEIAKYSAAYRLPDYRMGDARRASVLATLADQRRGSLLDVGTGRGETLAIADRLGFSPIHGTEVVAELLGDKVVYGEAHALPFGSRSFDVVTCFDVLEHLVPEDTESALEELRRVSRRTVIVSAADYSDTWNGVELHVNRRPYPIWRQLVEQYLGKPSSETWTGTSMLWVVHSGQ